MVMTSATCGCDDGVETMMTMTMMRTMQSKKAAQGSLGVYGEWPEVAPLCGPGSGLTHSLPFICMLDSLLLLQLCPLGLTTPKTLRLPLSSHQPECGGTVLFCRPSFSSQAPGQLLRGSAVLPRIQRFHPAGHQPLPRLSGGHPAIQALESQRLPEATLGNSFPFQL